MKKYDAISGITEIYSEPKGDFRRGFIDALPIMAGYMAVGFAFGILAIVKGFPLWSPCIMSFTMLSGTGQFALVNIYNGTGGFTAALFAASVLNIRYSLMSLAMTQKMRPDTPVWKRMLMACGDADEVVAVSLQRNNIISFSYFLGATISSGIGWVSGTFLGVFGSTLLPASVVSALGIALYAMFIAIVIPEARKTKAMLFCILTSALMNIAMEFIPFTKNISGGYRILACGILSAATAAALFPKNEART